VSAPLSKYQRCHTRICRPVGLSEADCEKVCRYASERIGLGYDFKNITNLMRYLFPWPVPQRWRRRMIALGSGDASCIICSSLIAQAFDVVRCPLLPRSAASRARHPRSGRSCHSPGMIARIRRPTPMQEQCIKARRARCWQQRSCVYVVEHELPGYGGRLPRSVVR
jgi:hypothetical protein